MRKWTELRRCFADQMALEQLCDRLVIQGEAKQLYVLPAAEPAALRFAARMGFSLPQTDTFDKTDLILCAEAEDEAAADAALAKITSAALLRPESGSSTRFTNPDFALAACPEADLAAVGVRNGYAAAVAAKCLDAGKGVLLMSDIAYEQELPLRKAAAEKQLPFFGSGAAGAMLCHQPLGICPQFTNGDTAILAASFTAALSLAFLLQRGGAGIRHILPVGRRDCFAECGGSSTRYFLDALAADPESSTLALVYKAGDFELLGRLTEQARTLQKQLFVYGSGQLKSGAFAETLGFAPSLARLAHSICTAQGKEGLTFLSAEEAAAMAAPYIEQFAPQQRYLRGLFLSDTMCGEIAAPLLEPLGAVWSNRPVRAIHLLQDLQYLKEHAVVDFGDTSLGYSVRCALQTPLVRNRRIITESHNRTVRLILTDWYGAEGCDEQYLSHLCSCIRTAKQTALADGRSLAVGCVVYTAACSPLDEQHTLQLLREAGAEVFFSADDAALFAKHLLCTEEPH
ncbi:MAG: hypothetical protein IKV55_06565 [Oscillospiraceae bacterium]|nr:hypothetical protein [Oscillospiraceae bacterium]